MPLVKLDAKQQKLMTAYWKGFFDRVTGKKPFRPNYSVCVPMNPRYAALLNRLEYKVYPELYGDEPWQRKIPQGIKG